jgi:ATP-binding cassette, subfamily C (CFTR/MRP), member 4
LFGLPYEKERFEIAIRASQLTRDVAIFGKGVETVIGERGVNISGGQKARISLARAVYSNADIVLLDDPLSAVDPEVANKIFYECIRECLKDKIVILVTHQLQFLEKCP